MEGRPNDGEIRRRNELLERAAEHPIRQDILRRLRPAGATLTADDLVTDTFARRQAHYHLTLLEDAGALEVAETMHEGSRVIRVFRSTPAGETLLAGG